MNARSNQKPRRFRRCAALSGLVLLFGVAASLRGQAVPVPNVTFDPYDPGVWTSLFDAAHLSSNQQQFEQIIEAGTYSFAAQWEAAANNVILNETLSVTNSDAFNSVAEYREYLRAELEIQKQDAFAAWEAAALAAIDNERDTFLAGLITQQQTETTSQAQDDLRDAVAANTSDEYRRQRDEFQANYQANVAAGLAQYQVALNAIAADAEAFQQEMVAAELQFQQDLQQIEAFEAAVRTQIQSAVDQLDQQLQNSSFFYEETCDAQNVCTPTSTLTTAGNNLAQIIADMRNGLANDAELSTLAQTLSTYLAGRETEAITTRDYWAGQVIAARNIWADDGGQNVAGLSYAFDFGAAYGGTLIGAMIEEFGGNTGTLANHLSSGHLVAQNFQNLDLCGSSTLHWPYPITGLTVGVNECWHGNGAGVGAFSYHAQGCGGPPLVCVWDPLAPSGHPEARIDAYGTYELYDPNADHNQGVWQGYVDNISLERTTWDGTLIPALQTWEAQVASYRANYAAWQAQVPALLQQNQAAYDARLAAITSDRTAFLNRAQSEYEAGLRKIAAAERARLDDAEDLAALEAEALAVVAASRSLSVTSAGEILSGEAIQSNLPDRIALRGVTSKARELLPDFAAAEVVLPAFARTLQGAYNVAVTEYMNAEALDVEEQILADIKKQLESYNAEVTDADVQRQLLAMMEAKAAENAGSVEKSAEPVKPLSDEDVLEQELNWELLGVSSTEELEELKKNVRESMEERQSRLSFEKIEKQADGSYLVTRKVSTGETRLRPGGDATNADHYIEDFVETTFRIEGAGSVKLAKTGELFADDFNVNQALDDFYGNINSYYKENVTKAFEQMGSKLNQQDNNAMTMKDRAEESTARQVKFANDAVSLAQTLLTGGTLAMFGESMIRGQIAEVVAQATGLPAGLLSAMLGSGNPMKAVQKFVEGELLAQFDKVLGLPPGVGSLLYGQVRGNDKRNTAEFKMGRDIFRSAVSAIPGGSVLASAGYAFPALDRAVVQPVNHSLDRMADRVGAFAANNAAAIHTVAHAGGLIPPELSLYGYSQRVYESGGFGKIVGRANTENAVSQDDFTREQLEKAAMFAIADHFGLPPGSVQMLQGLNLSPDLVESFVKGQITSLWETTLGLPPGSLSMTLNAIEQHGADRRDPNFKLGRDLVKNFATPLGVFGNNIPILDRMTDRAGYKVGRLFARNPMIPELMFPLHHGSYHGGTRGAVVSGVGYAATLASRFFSVGSVGVNASYSFADGYGGGVTVGSGEGNLNLGVGVNYSEGGGWGATAGVTLGGDVGMTAGLTYNEHTGFGVQAGLSAIHDTGYTGSFGVGWNKVEGYGASVGFGTGSSVIQGTYTQNNGFGAGVQISHAVGAPNAIGDSAISGGLTFSASTSQYGGNSYGVNYQQSHQLAGGGADWLLGNSGTLSGGLVYSTVDGLTASLGANFAGMSVNVSANEFNGGAGSVSFGAQPNFITSHEQLAGALAGMMQQQRAQFEQRRNLVSEAGDMERVFADEGMTAERWLEMDELERNDFRKRNVERITHAMEERGGEGLTDQEIAGYSQSQDGWLDVFTSLGESLAGVFTNEVYDPNGWRDENGKWHPRTCFVAGTLVRAWDGRRNVELVQLGDLVLSYNEATGELEWKQVINIFVRTADRIYRIQYSNGMEVETTATHPFYIVGSGWREASVLKPGDVSRTSSGKLEIARIIIEERTETVYNLSVEDNHNFFVGLDDVLVHNGDYVSAGPQYTIGLLKIASEYGMGGVWDYQRGQFDGMIGGSLSAILNVGELRDNPLSLEEELRRNEQMQQHVKEFFEGKSEAYIIGYLETHGRSELIASVLMLARGLPLKAQNPGKVAANSGRPLKGGKLGAADTIPANAEFPLVEVPRAAGDDVAIPYRPGYEGTGRPGSWKNSSGDGTSGATGAPNASHPSDNSTPQVGGTTAPSYKLKPQDLDWRGTGRTSQDALNEAFAKTGYSRNEFQITKWAKDKNGKSFPVEWRHESGAEVNIDIAHQPGKGPDAPHVGWQTGGKRRLGGTERGHILLDDVPVNRSNVKE